MTFYYKTYSWGNQSPEVSEETRKLWEHIAEKKNWRIVQLPNGFYQAEYLDIKSLAEKGGFEKEDVWVDVTRRETLESAEAAIDGSIAHYAKKLEFLKGPKIVKTFE